MKPALIVAAVALAVAPSFAQKGDVRVTWADLKAYEALLGAYHAGDDDAVTTLLTWDRKRIEGSLSLVDTREDSARPWPKKDFEAAAMLHADAALRDVSGAPSADTMPEIMWFHLNTGSRMLQRGGPDVRAFAARWYQAIALVLRDRLQLGAAQHFLKLGRDHLPGDPVVLYESGSLSEFLATAPSLEVVPRTSRDGMSLSEANAMRDRMIRARAERLRDAARWLRQSLEVEPAHLDAQLRLGRVLMLLGEDREALSLLLKVHSSGSAAVSYLAALYVGAIHERRGALAAAADAYREATLKLPDAPTAYVALSEVLQRSGQGDESRRILNTMLSGPAPWLEPWWFYHLQPSEVVNAGFNALRAEVRR